MAKKNSKEPTIQELTANLTSDYARWKEIYEHGCSDPGWSDGTNIDLKRNHIMYGKTCIERLLKDQFWLYPDIYYAPNPPKLPYSYMAKDRSYNVSPNVLKDSPYLEEGVPQKDCYYEKEGKIYHRKNKALTYEQIMVFGVDYESAKSSAVL